MMRFKFSINVPSISIKYDDNGNNYGRLFYSIPLSSFLSFPLFLKTRHVTFTSFGRN